MCFPLTFFKIAVWNEGVSVHHSPFITTRDGGKMDAARCFLFSARKLRLAIVTEDIACFNFALPFCLFMDVFTSCASFNRFA